MAGKLSELQVKVLCYIEQRFWETGGIPTPEKIAEDLDIILSTVKSHFKNETFRTALVTRGVDLSADRSKGLLDVMQLTLANSLLNTHDKRSVREKLKELNITPQKYNAWLATKEFRNYLAGRAEQMFGSHDHELYSTLLSSATGGDIAALKVALEMRGIYNPKVNVEVNLPQVLGQVVEIITRHVTDPGTLAAIADDLELLETGGIRPKRVQQALPEIAGIGESGIVIDSFSTQMFS